jgi:hypothetical protein
MERPVVKTRLHVTKHDVLFLDTTIQIARICHDPRIRESIQQRLSAISFSVTGEIVRLEYKRRFLKDARYLLDLFELYGDHRKVFRHVTEKLGRHQKRKQQISLQVLCTLMEGEDDASLSDRAKLLLTGLVRDGLDEFEEDVGHVRSAINCGCASIGIKQKGKRYDFGAEKCSKVGSCGIVEFLDQHKQALHDILQHLEAIPAAELSVELERARDFIRLYNSNPGAVRAAEPCQTVGDLLIALESVEIPAFYTINERESTHLCKALEQSLIVRPSNADKSERELEAGTW